MINFKITKKYLRPEALLTILSILFQIQHWSLHSHGLRLRSDTADFVTIVVFDNWYSPFTLAALLFAGAFWLARRFPEWGLMPYVCLITVLAAPLITYKIASVYRVTYFTGNPSFFLAEPGFFKSLLNTLVYVSITAFVVGQLVYLMKQAAIRLENAKNPA